MLKHILFLTITFSFFTSIFAVEENDSTQVSVKEQVVDEVLYAPTIGLGLGMFKFYGDVMNANNGNPLISNIGYVLHVKQELNSYLAAKFYVLFGSLSANERSVDRNLNLKSKITVGGFELMYNFDHFLKSNRLISPFISLGIESIEFHSKTDLYDRQGIKYNYWSDGSIRDLAESSPNASNAVVIQRDYTYETNLRELDYDGYGKYAERTFAIPLGIGTKMHLTENVDFTIGSTFHFTFSDLIDNVDANSTGERLGTQTNNGGNDNFLLTSFTISYNFLKHNKTTKINDIGEDVDPIDFDNNDEDDDGVLDFIDNCPWTPEGVEVDSSGCPLDFDLDLVPNYMDDELETSEGAPVTPAGIEMSDEMIFEAYQRYTDSTGMFAETETRIIAGKRLKKKNYKVKIGEFIGVIDADLVDKFLSVPDVEINNIGDSLTIIAVGDYNSLPEALKRKMQLTAEGFDAAIVIKEEKNGTFTSVGDKANNMTVDYYPSANVNSQGLLFRVQLGAFSKRLPTTFLKNIGGIMEFKADDGLWKYLHKNSYKSAKEAAELTISLAIDYGVKDAFIVAYKDGKRISLTLAGVESSAVENIKPTKTNVLDKSAVKFKIQIGSYKNQLPIEVLNMFMKLERVEQAELSGGLIRYTTGGEFTSYDEAESFKLSVIEKGIGSAFIIALHHDDLIPISKAKEIIAE
jgi:hypothetical protein